MKKIKIASPDEIINEKKQGIIDALNNSSALLQHVQVTAGFDGFIDSLVRIIRKKQSAKPPAFFTTIKQFGEYIMEKHSASFSLEMEESITKPGGNMPIMADAMGTLGIRVNCVGAFGYPELHHVFDSMSANCIRYSFANPGTSTAIEFNDGKMFLAQMGQLNVTGWQKIKEQIGAEKLKSLFRQAQMICLLNWSEIDASTDIWQGLLNEVFTDNPNREQFIFADLSDCSKRSDRSISQAMDLLKAFSGYGRVILSLNKNEAAIISKLLIGKKNAAHPNRQGQGIFKTLGLHTLLIHSAHHTWAFRDGLEFATETFYTATPKISTGAGDNFNAGFCTAQLLGLDLPASVLFANALAGAYVRKGSPASAPDIISLLEQH